MTEIYIHIFIMTVVASVGFFFMKLTSKATEKYLPASWHYYSSIILFSLFAVPIYAWVQPKDLSSAVTVFIPVNNAADTSLIDVIPYVLLVGTIFILGFHGYRYVKMHRWLQFACEESFDDHHLMALRRAKQTLTIKRNIPVYISPYMTTPFIYGILKPKVVLPKLDFSEEELRHIFLHELTHYKRGDLVTKALATVIQALHWFNPMVYMARRDMDRFGEFACDERITKHMDPKEKTRYCELLLAVLWNVLNQKESHFAAMSQGRKHLERRLKAISASRARRQRTVLACGVVITVLMVTLGTTAGFTANAHVETFDQHISDDSQVKASHSDAESMHDIHGEDSKTKTKGFFMKKEDVKDVEVKKEQ
ncbi:M56 family metallopeptidase [Salicibibacter cibarius]|uniref:M56 family metallopeptidase n=1 Tax=Salicibibacter cibarius TaxID=2743000 RepID=A0A7T7CA23_9BACI|nr:M56 family metallopeptidase [Salicibibacter cibarius]QQK74462.1 M56 family metallopeptidase [Salicibibacter cibarius]